VSLAFPLGTELAVNGDTKILGNEATVLSWSVVCFTVVDVSIVRQTFTRLFCIVLAKQKLNVIC
jgi:hypothetical protein